MISAQIRAQVRQRAENACEYCYLHQDDSPLLPGAMFGAVYISLLAERRQY